MQSLILASSSPYKKMLLERLHIPFSCYSPDIDEAPRMAESPAALAERLSQEKALTVAKRFPGTLVIGADQVEDLDGTILGKPGSHVEAIKQLSAQSGRTMLFHCGLTVMRLDSAGHIEQNSRVNTTEVSFRTLSLQQIENYLRLDQPYDCAGSFKAEALGISLFTAVQSNDPSALIGLPLIDCCSMLADFGMKIP
jgi:septum formation protein